MTLHAAFSYFSSSSSVKLPRSTQYYYQQTHNDVRFAAVIRQKLLF